MIKKFTLIFSLLVLSTTLAQAQESPQETSIAAVVDDKAITTFELEQRIKLVIETSKMTDNEETQNKLKPAVLRAMIDEKLHEKEAKKLGITIPEAQIDEVFSSIAMKAGVTEQVLEQDINNKGLISSSFRDQIKAQLLWNKLLSQKVKPKVRISEDEMLDSLEVSSSSSSTSEEFFISQIVLPVENPESENRIKELADKIVTEIRNGASVSGLAKEFSNLNVSSDEELKKWVSSELLDREILNALAGANTGEILTPVRTPGGYYVIILHDKRSKQSQIFDSITADLRQFIYPLTENASREEADKAEKTALNLTSKWDSCDEFTKQALKSNDPSMVNLGKMSLSKILEPVRSRILALGAGEKATPFRTPYGLHIVMVCSKTLNIPAEEKEKLKQEIYSKKIELEARKFMRNLRRDSLVEIRL